MLDQLLRQLGELVLGSVPTMIIFLILVLAYRFVLHAPLLKVLAKRRELTTGAIEKAHAAIAAADAKSQEYEAKLRVARAEIFRQREQRVQQWNAQKENTLASARLAAHERIAAAKKAIELEAVTARVHVEAGADQLAGQILQAILPAHAEGAH